MKRLLILCGLLTAFFASFSAPVKYVGCTPSDGSEITSWNFTLEFDITDALADAAISNPNDEVGIGVMALASSQYTTLYKGEKEENIILGKALTKVLNGNNEKFVVNGNKVEISFDITDPIIKGQKYTIEVKNDFYLYIKGQSGRITNSKLAFKADPLILTFYGGDLSDSKLFVESCSIDMNNQLETLKSLTFHLNSLFSINNGGMVLIKEGENVVASTNILTVSENNPKQLVAEFSEPVILRYGKTYTIQLPEGVLTHKDNANVSNIIFETNVIGASAIYFGAKSYTPDGSRAILPETVSIYFDVPDGKTLLPKSDKKYSGHTTCVIYTEGDEQNVVEKGGDVTSDGKGFTWDLSNIIYSPSTTYFLKKEKGSIFVFDEAETHLPEYVNEETIVSWTTPSVEEVNLPIATGACYTNPKLGKHDDTGTPIFRDGDSYGYLNIIEFEIAKEAYEYNGKKYKITEKADANWKLYDVTSGKRVFVKDVTSTALARETMYEYYGVIQLWVKNELYQGHSYEIVLDKDCLQVEGLPNALKNYVRSEEVVIRVTGSKPLSVNLFSKTIQDKDELEELYTAVWVFEGEFILKDGSTVGLSRQLPNSSAVTYPKPLSSTTLSGKTYVSASFISEYYGTPITFSDITNCKLIFPAGILTYAGDDKMTNKEIVTSFVGVPKSSYPASVSVNVNVNGLHSMSHMAVKGEAYKFTLAHDNNWVVESVKHNGVDVASANGTYTTAPLTEADNNIEASLKFAHNVSIADFTTGVGEVIADGSAISIGKDGDSVIVKGLKGGEHISVYSLNGMMVKDTIVGADMNSARISLPADSVLIILVESADESQAFKVKL